MSLKVRWKETGKQRRATWDKEVPMVLWHTQCVPFSAGVNHNDNSQTIKDATSNPTLKNNFSFFKQGNHVLIAANTAPIELRVIVFAGRRDQRNSANKEKRHRQDIKAMEANTEN